MIALIALSLLFYIIGEKRSKATGQQKRGWYWLALFCAATYLVDSALSAL